VDDAFQPVEPGDEQVLEVEAFQILLNSSDEIERREDKISFIRSSLISGRMGGAFWRSIFTGHGDGAEAAWKQG